MSDKVQRTLARLVARAPRTNADGALVRGTSFEMEVHRPSGLHVPKGMKATRQRGREFEELGMKFGSIERWQVSFLQRAWKATGCPMLEVCGATRGDEHCRHKEGDEAPRHLGGTPVVMLDVAVLCWSCARYHLGWALQRWATDEEFEKAVRALDALYGGTEALDAIHEFVETLQTEEEDDRREDEERRRYERKRRAVDQKATADDAESGA